MAVGRAALPRLVWRLARRFTSGEPAELCRRHFFDMRYHARHHIHAGARFAVREQDGIRFLCEQRTRFMGRS